MNDSYNYTISVIIPSYKPKEYFWECLDSVYNQTLSGEQYEVIIILNGCKEPYYSDTADYINRHLDRCTFRLLQTDTPGVSNARNIGIDNASGEYLTFVDDDDIISNSYLEEMLEVSSHSCIGCAISYQFENNTSKLNPSFLSQAYEKCRGKAFSLYNYRQFLSPPYVKLIHKNIINSIRFPVNLRKSEDSVFCLAISPKIEDMKLADESAIYYQRVRQGSAMHTKASRWNEIMLHLRIEMEYLKVWLSNPFRINAKFAASRMAACIKNLRGYLKQC